MSDNDPLLNELRKISSWADMQRKVTKWSLIVAAVTVPALVVFAIVMDHRVNNTIENMTPAGNADWFDVDSDVRRGEFDKAIKLGEELIQKTPGDPEAHRRLARTYLAVGRIQKAREHYATAFRLFPTEENEKLLEAIDRRIKDETPQPERGANGSQPSRSGAGQTSAAVGSHGSP